MNRIFLYLQRCGGWRGLGASLLVSASMWGSACSGDPSMRALDRETAGMIGAVQRGHLGEEMAEVPGSTKPGGGTDIYKVQPVTRNPGVEALPAGSGTAASSRDEVSDDGGVALLLDLEGALGYAIRNARAYKTEKEELFRTTLDFLAERHLWGPRFFETVTSTFTGTPESGDHDQAHEMIHELRVTQRLPYGGEVSAAALVGLVNQLRTEAGSTAEGGQDASVQLAATLPLLRGGGVEARESLIQAERDVVYAVRGFERFRRTFLVEVSSRYYDLLRQQSGITNLRQQLENLEWLTRRIRALAEAGREPYFEVQRAQAQVLFAQNSLLNAEEDYANALDGFKIVIGMPVEQRVRVVAVEVVAPEPDTDMDESVRSALALRLDLQTSGDRVADSQRRVRVARRDLQPDLDVFAEVELPTDPDRKHAGFGLDAGAGSYRAGVTLGVPLDRRVEQVRLRQALIDMESARRGYSLDRDRVAQEVRRAIRRLEQAGATFRLQNQNIQVAKRRLRGVVLRLKSLGPRDFIEAQEDLLDALNQRDEARRDLRVSVLQFLLATGQMRVTAEGRWGRPAALMEASEGGAEPGTYVGGLEY